VQQNKKQTK